MEPYQFPSHYPHQSRLADHDLFAHDQYPKVGVSNYPHSSLAVGAQQSHAQTSEGVINPPRHGRSDQVYASPMSMDTTPMFLYPGTSSTPHCSNLSQYPYDNLRIPPTLDNNYIPISSHYEVFPSNSSRTMDFGVRTVSIYPFYPFLTHRSRYRHRWILILREHNGSANPGFHTKGCRPLLRFPSCPGEHQHRRYLPVHPDGLGRCSPCHTGNTLPRTPRLRDNTSTMLPFSRPSSSIS